jgi:hypothetical protein
VGEMRAASRRSPISLYATVARTEGYTCAARVWDFPLVQGPVSVAPRQKRARPVTIRNFSHRCTRLVIRP